MIDYKLKDSKRLTKRPRSGHKIEQKHDNKKVTMNYNRLFTTLDYSDRRVAL